MLVLGKLNPPLWHETDTRLRSNDPAVNPAPKLQAKHVCIDPCLPGLPTTECNLRNSGLKSARLSGQCQPTGCWPELNRREHVGAHPIEHGSCKPSNNRRGTAVQKDLLRLWAKLMYRDCSCTPCTELLVVVYRRTKGESWSQKSCLAYQGDCGFYQHEIRRIPFAGRCCQEH